MESSKQPLTNKSDEIDLLELLIRVVLIVKHNFVMIIIFFLVGSGLGLTYYQVLPNAYESKMLISSDILTESYSKQLMGTISKLIKEGNVKSLSKKLGLPEKQVSKIGSVLIASALDKPEGIAEDSKVYLTVQVIIADNSILPELQTALINYLQRNEFVKVRVEQKKKYINAIVEKINLELADLEKLKTRIAEGGPTQSKKENLVLIDPSKINSTIIDLNKEKFKLQNELEIVNSVQVVEGFTVFNKPTSPKLSLSLAAGTSFGLFFVAVFIAFKGIRSMLKFSEEKLDKA